MDNILLLGGELASVTAALLACCVTLLFYRAPNHARWLEGDGATTTVMIALMTAVIFSLAWLVKGIAGIVGDPLYSISLAVLLLSGISWLLWKLLRMRHRLQAAEEGRSPFHPDLGAPRPPHPPRRRAAT